MRSDNIRRILTAEETIVALLAAAGVASSVGARAGLIHSALAMEKNNSTSLLQPAGEKS